MESFWLFWQQIPTKIDPVIVRLGFWELRWYNLMYILALLLVYFYTVNKKKQPESPFLSKKKEWNKEVFKDLTLEYLILVFFGLLTGGRLGYFLFYNFNNLFKNPEHLFGFYNGSFVGFSGMSYHGGLIGILIVSFFFAKKRKINFWKWSDIIIFGVPLAYTLGRIGNFLNGELYGRITQAKWGMYFPLAYDLPIELRHPSQLYEAFFEGIFVFVSLLYFKRYLNKKKTKIFRRIKKIDGIYLILYVFSYGLVRFILEFWREPDAHLGYIAYRLTMGQILCIIMILTSILLLLYKSKFKKSKVKNQELNSKYEKKENHTS